MARFVNRVHQHNEAVESVSCNFVQQKMKPHAHHSWPRFFKENTFTALIGSLFMFSLVFSSSLEGFNHFLKTSLVGQPDIEFTGTVFPIENGPSWTALTDAERNFRYDQIPQSKIMALPKYDLSAMRAGMVWGEGNEAERNTYVTYPVPHLGNYKLDGTEESGSHPGMDIKALIGTPVKSIANGIVTKVKNVSYGGGQYIVISHPNAPMLNNPNQTTTLYSSYLHLSEQLVSVGEVVEKGQIIGKTGNTGMSTAPHLHFQIDQADAPFHPYWPFTTQESSEAGYASAFDAVKSGFGKEKAQLYMVHPVEYVEQYKSSSTSGGLFASSSNVVPLNVAPTVVSNPQEDFEISAQVGLNKFASGLGSSRNKSYLLDPPKASAPVVSDVAFTQPSTKPFDTALTVEHQHFDVHSDDEQKAEDDFVIGGFSENPRPGYYSLEFVMDGGYVPNVPNEVLVRVANAKSLNEDIWLDSTLNERAKIVPSVLTKYDFTGGVALVKVTPEGNSNFRLLAESDSLGIVKSSLLEPTNFVDVSDDHFANNEIQRLSQMKVIEGYDDGTFQPEKIVNRVEAVTLITRLNGIRTESGFLPFDDTDDGAWYVEYVYPALEKEIVKGYPDNTLRPGNSVSRAEFLAMVIRAGDYTVKMPDRNLFADIGTEDWFAPYFDFAITHDLLPDHWTEYRNIEPGATVNRGEAAYILDHISRRRIMSL
jgi:hypothetical protein